MQDAILVLNSGSSSIKFSGYEVKAEKRLALLFKGEIEGIGLKPRFIARYSTGKSVAGKPGFTTDKKLGHEELLSYLIDWVAENLGGRHPVAVGHRVVHGGTSFAAPVIVNSEVLAKLQSLCPLVPLHQPHNLSAIRAIANLAPKLTQIACFDTAFHHAQPRVAKRFALSQELHDAGVKRYGFHGLSYEYVASCLPEQAPAIASGRVVAAHLGNGASMCAMQGGKSVYTTMGFSSLEGVPMGTRCGALDPGVILYLLRERKLDAGAIEDLLYHRSGLLGVSGLSSDMRELLNSNDDRAEEAIELFVYRICQELGALAASLGGLDGLVFTGGIGEHSSAIRQRVCDASAWLGIEIDPLANARNELCISPPNTPVSVWVIPTDEELMIARHTLDLLRRRSAVREYAQTMEDA